MKKLTIFIVLMIIIAQASYAQTSIASASVYSSKPLSINVDKILYTTNGSNHFFVKITIVNSRNGNLAVDLTDRKIIHPNQWGIYDTPERKIIDEIRMIPDTLDEVAKKDLLEKYKNNKLTYIPPYQSIDYYIDFNNSDKKNVHIEKGKFMIISFNGQLKLIHSEIANIIDVSKDFSNDLAISFPLQWKEIPKDAIILTH